MKDRDRVVEIGDESERYQQGGEGGDKRELYIQRQGERWKERERGREEEGVVMKECVFAVRQKEKKSQ